MEPEIERETRSIGRSDWSITRVTLRLIRVEILLSQQSRIFLSHRGANKPLVTRFHDVLTELGFDPWLDKEDIPVGANLHRKIDSGMSSSCAAVFFITPDFKDDQFLGYEVERALTRKMEAGERFAIITLALANQNAGSRGVVPSTLRNYRFGEPNSELEALHMILRALPLGVGPVEWRTP